jgi:NADH:ubiquinone oxidoreductase subunit E
MPTVEQTVDLGPIRAIVDKAGKGRDACIRILQEMQAAYGYLPSEAIRYVVKHTDIGESQLFGVATFYEQFRFTPVGKHLIRVCHGTACHVAGADLITSALEEELNVESGKTTPDMMYTLSSVACMGACSQAPVMRIGDQTYGNLTPDKTRTAIRAHMSENGVEKG